MSHALLSPSASHRWIACPQSARLTEFLADSESSYASEGTLAHSVAEAKLNYKLGRAKQTPVSEDAEMDEYTSDYADFVMEQTDGLDMVVAPIGGGGMISGTCLTLSTLAPEVQVIAAEPEQAVAE